ncbi:unnamed protein product [Cylindrotheca closterium]|uniref:RING-type domain-containing protein n=1 Tax=Cylindrotheca closterium TaxID=2856 RepID=A0AAD2FYH9_9STRA|nr:unnamed protein product [Cylindrotheca closterium]
MAGSVLGSGAMMMVVDLLCAIAMCLCLNFCYLRYMKKRHRESEMDLEAQIALEVESARVLEHRLAAIRAQGRAQGGALGNNNPKHHRDYDEDTMLHFFHFETIDNKNKHYGKSKTVPRVTTATATKYQMSSSSPSEESNKHEDSALGHHGATGSSDASSKTTDAIHKNVDEEKVGTTSSVSIPQNDQNQNTSSSSRSCIPAGLPQEPPPPSASSIIRPLDMIRQRFFGSGQNKDDTRSKGHSQHNTEEGVLEEANDDDNEDEDCCCICLEGYEHGEVICTSKTGFCNHVFHKECLFEWVKKNHDCCPLCRTVLVKEC